MGMKKEAIVKMLEGKSHVHISMSVDSGAGQPGDLPLSRVSVKIEKECLLLNNMFFIPFSDEYITSLRDDSAEITFLDPDNQIVRVKLVIEPQ